MLYFIDVRANEIKRARCRDVSFLGKGVAETDEGVVFVDGFFPGEEGEIRILYRRNGSWFGKLRKLTRLSPDRIEPKCPVASACGGCQFQQYAYAAQLKIKKKLVADAFRRHGFDDVGILDVIGMDDPFRYRNKVQMPFGRDGRGRLVLGFYRSGSHEIIPIKDCPIEDERAISTIGKIKRLAMDLDLKPYDEKTDDGLLRHILVRTSTYKNEMMVVLVTRHADFPGRKEFTDEIISRCPEITTLVQNVNERRTNVILGEKEIILYGPGHIEDVLCGLRFRISAKSFFQVNHAQAEKLYETALSFASLNDESEVFDAFSGIGTITLLAARRARHVTGAEIVREAVEDAKENAALNGVANVDFISDDAGKALKECADEGRHFDVVFVDPPRKGLYRAFVDALRGMLPSRIVYISCEPETLARDCNLLRDLYSLEKVRPIDMFPFTRHIESVALLTRLPK